MVKCKNCGIDNVENAEYCQECGNKIKEFPTKYENVSFLGFAGIILFLPLAIISGIYLYTRPEKFAKDRGKFIVGLGILLWIIYAIALTIFR